MNLLGKQALGNGGGRGLKGHLCGSVETRTMCWGGCEFGVGAVRLLKKAGKSMRKNNADSMLKHKKNAVG